MLFLTSTFLNSSLSASMGLLDRFLDGGDGVHADLVKALYQELAGMKAGVAGLSSQMAELQRDLSGQLTAVQRDVTAVATAVKVLEMTQAEQAAKQEEQAARTQRVEERVGKLEERVAVVDATLVALQAQPPAANSPHQPDQRISHEVRALREAQVALVQHAHVRVLVGAAGEATPEEVAETLRRPRRDVVAVAPLGARREVPAAARRWKVTFASAAAAAEASAAARRDSSARLYLYDTAWQRTLHALAMKVQSVLQRSAAFARLAPALRGDHLWLHDDAREIMYPLWLHMPADGRGDYVRMSAAAIEEIARAAIASPPEVRPVPERGPRGSGAGARPSAAAQPEGAERGDEGHRPV